MRKITEQAIKVLRAASAVARQRHLPMMAINLSVRDKVIVHGDIARWLLWDNSIVRYDGHGIMLSDCGYPTPTTAERLRGLLEAFNIRTHDGDRIYYSVSCGFYVWRERPARNNCNKTVKFRHVIAESNLIITPDCFDK